MGWVRLIPEDLESLDGGWYLNTTCSMAVAWLLKTQSPTPYFTMAVLPPVPHHIFRLQSCSPFLLGVGILQGLGRQTSPPNCMACSLQKKWTVREVIMAQSCRRAPTWKVKKGLPEMTWVQSQLASEWLWYLSGDQRITCDPWPAEWSGVVQSWRRDRVTGQTGWMSLWGIVQGRSASQASGKEGERPLWLQVERQGREAIESSDSGQVTEWGACREGWRILSRWFPKTVVRSPQGPAQHLPGLLGSWSQWCTCGNLLWEQQ